MSTKPWEETWFAFDTSESVEVVRAAPEKRAYEVDGGETFLRDEPPIHAARASFRWGNFGDSSGQKAAGVLAAAAPDMARALLAAEWKGCCDYVGDGGYRCCPCCGGVAPEDIELSDAKRDVEKGLATLGHRADCALEGALKKAGVR